MDKIIILSDDSGENHELATCLRKLFPECEIQILSKPMKSPGDIPVAIGMSLDIPKQTS